MILLLVVPFAVALVALSVLGFAGIGPLTDERRAARDGSMRALGPAVGLLLGIGFLVATVIASALIIGVGPEDTMDRERAARLPSSARPTGASTAALRTNTTATTQPSPGGARRRVVLGPEVAIEADGGETFPVSYDVADGLGPATVLRMRVTGFEPFARATAKQCAESRAEVCGNALSVQFDADGAAEFQYLVTDDFLGALPVPGRCRADAAACTVVVGALIGNRHGQIQTVFGDTVSPAGRISVTPTVGLSLVGETVTVEVTDYPPGAELTAMLCAAPDATGARCGAPGPTAPLVVSRNGTGRTELAITPGPVGAERAPCFRGDDCGVSVASAEVFARAPVVPISFAAPPGATYDSTRLVIGLGFALFLLAIAAALLRRTDWSPVGEAAAPEIDDAEYADLDAIIAALPPVEDESVRVS